MRPVPRDKGHLLSLGKKVTIFARGLEASPEGSS